MFDLDQFKKEAEANGLTATGNDADVVIKKGDVDVLHVFTAPNGGPVLFKALLANEHTVTSAGDNLVPSDQDNVAHHAACCARDLSATLPPPKPKAKAEEPDTDDFTPEVKEEDGPKAKPKSKAK